MHWPPKGSHIFDVLAAALEEIHQRKSDQTHSERARRERNL